MTHKAQLKQMPQMAQKAETILADRLIFWKRDLPTVLGVSTRTLDRWLSCQEFPAPDVTVHGRPVWKRQTIQDWCGAK